MPTSRNFTIHSRLFMLTLRARRERNSVQKNVRNHRLDFLFCRSPVEYEEGDPSPCEGEKAPMLSRESDADCYTHARLDYHATVRELPSNERPRERLEHFGSQALSLAELLAIILRTGTRGDNALELANKLLSKFGGLPGLVRADFRELCAEYGMGEAKSAQVKAALEIGRRLALVDRKITRLNSSH